MTLCIAPGSTSEPPVSLLGPGWLKDTAARWREACATRESHISIDLSSVTFIRLLDWIHLCSWIQRITSDPSVRQIDIDVLGRQPLRLVPPQHFVRAEGRADLPTKFTAAEQAFSRSRYRVLGFIEGLGTLDALNDPAAHRRVIYPGVGPGAALLRSWYSPRAGEHPTVVLGLHPIAQKADCTAFLDSARILAWRQRMEERFLSSPIFVSDEVWRVVSHELAANILEHAGASGMIAARVVETLKTGRRQASHLVQVFLSS